MARALQLYEAIQRNVPHDNMLYRYLIDEGWRVDVGGKRVAGDDPTILKGSSAVGEDKSVADVLNS